MKISITEAAEFLRSRNKFYILSHANPDGDTLGCAYGLCSALQQIGKTAKVLCDDEISTRFAYLKEAVKEQEFEADTVISVDVADIKLLGGYEEIYGDKIELCIDHHISNTGFATRVLVDSNAAAAAEVIYRVIQALGAKITAKIAACIYTGISTDTGCFRFSNTTPETHIIAAELMRIFNPADLNYTLFDMKTKSRIKLEQEVLKSIEYYCDGKCAVVVLTREMLDSVDIEDANGLSSLPKQIEGIEVGVTVKEKKDGVWKASMRSVSVADVQRICSTLGGGGHKRAAGCTVNGTLDEVKKIIIDAIGKELTLTL